MFIKISTYILVAMAFFSSNILLASQNEIRRDKTIRLGGYFYGCWKGENGDMSAEQMIWIANHLDIVSAISGVSKETISKIRKINAKLKFYIMTFATTLFEDQPTWSGWPSFYPKIMNEWIVRLKDGKEAIGIRRKSGDSKTHIMDLGSKEWADFFRNYYSKLIKERGANRVAIDEIMWEGYWGVNVNEMAKYSSKEEIRKTCYEWLKRIAYPHKFEIIHQAFWEDPQEFSDGIWGEFAFHAEDSDARRRTFFNRKMNWEEIVRNMEEYSGKGRTYIWAA